MSKLQISKRAREVTASPMRKFYPLIKKAEGRGIKVYKLNVGDPELETPPIFFKSIKAYGKKTLGYAPTPGITEHVKAWQKYYKKFNVGIEASNIIPTMGCAEAITLAMQAVADAGDEILVFEPVYTSYKSFAVMAGIKLQPVLLHISDNFAIPKQQEIEKKINKRTKAIVVVNPDNPTGKLWSEKELSIIVKIAKKHNLFIISDETYREIRFDGKKGSCLLADKATRQNIIVVDSVSKRFSMPGARIGCVASFNSEIMSGILKFAQARLSAGTLEQLATIPLLNESAKYTKKLVAEYKKHRQAVLDGLNKIPGAVFKPAQGAFYQAVKLPVKDAEDFVRFMIEKFTYKNQTVMVTPIQDLYITKGLGKDEIRIAYVLNRSDLKTAMEVLKRGLEAYLKK